MLLIGCSSTDSQRDTDAGIASATDLSMAPEDSARGADAVNMSDSMVPPLMDVGFQQDGTIATSDVTDDTVTPNVDVEEPVDIGPPPPLSIPGGLIGAAANQSDAPALSGVLDLNGEAVLDSQLTGHWTVLWFYPFASTFG